MNSEEIKAHYAAQGLIAVDRYDRGQMLAIMREQRRRYAHDDAYSALGEIAALMHEHINAELPDLDRNAAVDTLLAVGAMLGSFAREDLHAANVVNAMGYLADDLAREAGQ